MVGLDANVLVRYIVQDDKAQARKATAVIENLTPDQPAFISCIVLCEINWVLKTTYKISKAERINIFKRILSVAVFDIENLDVCWSAAKKHAQGQADFSDYLVLETARQNGYDAILTFDKNALKSPHFKSP